MGKKGKKKFRFKRPKGKKDNNPTAGGSSSALPPPPWVELPRDVTENILRRLGQAEILENVRKVCSTWRSVCSEPSLWRVIDLKIYSDDIMCRRAVDLSQGELIDISIEYFGTTDDLLHYISQRSSRLKCLRLSDCSYISSEGLIASVKNFPELEELHLSFMPSMPATAIEAISISCPKLKSFTLTKRSYRFMGVDDSYALTIAKNMPDLNNLSLLGNRLSNEGLKAIFDSCPNLESLDLRQCFNVDLEGDLGRLCSERIKNLKRSFNLTADDYEWYDMIYEGQDYWNDSSDDCSVGGYDYYDDYTDTFSRSI